MAKRLSKLEVAQKKTEEAADKTNRKISELGEYTSDLYVSLTEIQGLFDRIRNVPEENRLQYEKIKAIRVNWKQQAERIEREYINAKTKAGGQGAAGIGAGIAVAALGPTAAMGIATTFGVASTGTAISALSGAAATNAALAWLGGGALAAGGGGMAAGNALLTLAGPVGWAIAGVSIAASGVMFFKAKHDKERLENIYTLISERDTKSYELAIVEISERIKRITDEGQKLKDAIRQIKTFGTDYTQMTEKQQYELGAYVNLMEATTALLVNPILGLQPKYTERDLEEFCAEKGKIWGRYYQTHKIMVITLANLLYKIPLDYEDQKLLAKSMRKNKEFLSAIQMSKKEFDNVDLINVEDALNFKYKNEAC